MNRETLLAPLLNHKYLKNIVVLSRTQSLIIESPCRISRFSIIKLNPIGYINPAYNSSNNN
jgi:hypothetical protein